VLVTCATIASCDEFDDIVAWGEHHLDSLRRFSALHFGIPGVRWSIASIQSCLESWIKVLRPSRCDLIVIDARPRAAPTTSARSSKPCIHLCAYAYSLREVTLNTV